MGVARKSMTLNEREGMESQRFHHFRHTKLVSMAERIGRNERMWMRRLFGRSFRGWVAGRFSAGCSAIVPGIVELGFGRYDKITSSKFF